MTLSGRSQYFDSLLYVVLKSRERILVARTRGVMKNILFAILAAAFFLTAACRSSDGPSGATISLDQDLAPLITETTTDNGQGVSNVVTDEMRAELDKLVSTDPDVRRKALAELAFEFSSDTPPSERKYSNYGDELLPYLYRVISDLNDRYADNAVKAIFWMTWTNKMRLDERSLEGNDELKRALERVSHFPIPSNYKPMKEALVSALIRHKNAEARFWAASTLSIGFEPLQEIEGILATQFPIEEGAWRVQSAILGALSNMADRGKLGRSTELVILGGLASSNIKTQQGVARLIEKHRIDGGLESLIDNLPSARDDINLKAMLRAIVSFGSADESQILELERIARETDEDDRKIEIQSAIDTLRSAVTE